MAPHLAVCTCEQCLFNFSPEQGVTNMGLFIQPWCVLGLGFFLENLFSVLLILMFLNIIVLDADRYLPLNYLNLFYSKLVLFYHFIV